MNTEYKTTQPYKLGKKYARLGKMLMDEKTDLRDLCELADELGLEISISVEPNNVATEYVDAA